MLIKSKNLTRTGFNPLITGDLYQREITVAGHHVPPL